MDPYTYSKAARQRGTFTGDLIAGWTPLYRNEFRGVTEQGTLRTDVHRLDPARPGEGAPVAAMVAAADDLLSCLDEEARARISYPVDAVEWQTWANPEFIQFDTGVRLEFQPQQVQQKALALVAASLSPEGYELAHNMMLINGFLGEVVGLQSIFNEFSYNIALYGQPDLSAPWGWQLYGHHCALNCLVVQRRMVLTPAFLGAEPNEIDAGPHEGVRAFTGRIELGIALMAALSETQRREATVYEQMVDPTMPPGRVHPGDERHLAGAFQDNRVIPFEGIRAVDMPTPAQELLMAIVEEFVILLPAGPRSARLREVRKHLDQTWFCWIGGHQPGDVFYYRVQSPVIIAELDHHCGVVLDYDTPKPFHIHTVMRTPHGNDYGRAYVRQWDRD
ncbi:DUF3500 domain-containing protein [Mycolicibacterium moriokaense]|nr:DUF3500 domain-containing protein [Mycolicibacterium moriokaense]